MKLSLLITCILRLQLAIASQSYESLDTLGPIGTHFGYPSNASFDYVIVGGGTAGLALANRLAENDTHTVAVVEAGSFYELDNGNKSSIPALGLGGVGNKPEPADINPKIDWEQYTTPQTALNNQRILYQAGKTLGGGSARNYQVYHRATKDAYQKWADQVEDPTYAFDHFLPYFEKSAQYTPSPPSNNTIPASQSVFSPKSGPLKVSYPQWQNSFNSWAGRAFEEIGVPEVHDFQSGELIGYQVAPSTQDPRTQLRDSSETSYLRDSLEKSSSLTVFTDTLAKKIVFGKEKKAQAVMLSSQGRSFKVSAKKEIILSAGTFRSPQLLMVSGVGPAATLKANEIPVVADRPGVGQNMWDHVLFGPSWKVNLVTHSIIDQNQEYTEAAINSFNSNRTGILTSIGTGLLGWEKIPPHLRKNLQPSTVASLDRDFPADWPELELIHIDAWNGYQTDLLNGAPKDGEMYVTIAAATIAPFSRGNVTITSSDTNDKPLVSPNWLVDPKDMDVAVQIFKRARELFAAKALKPILIGEEAFPGQNVTSDAEIADLIRKSASKVHHASCTCAMGRRDDPVAVVDSQARVIGVQNLRVVDASAMPILPPGHPQATIYALAEKISDCIKSGE